MPKGIVKAPCMRTCYSFSEPGGFKKPHTSNHSPGTHRRRVVGGLQYGLQETSSSRFRVFLAYVLMMWSEIMVK